jgi:hypothetical protein
MKESVTIQKVSTGEVRTYTHDLPDADQEWYLEEDGWHFMWFEGNYSCDYNLALFFARAAGEDEAWEMGCSEDQYKLLKLVIDGQEVWSEADSPH